MVDSQAPVLISQSGNTVVYRYWTTGAYTSGSVSITFLTGGYGFTDGTKSTFTGPSAPVNFTVDGVATPNIHYVDVQLTPTAGDSLDLSSIEDSSPEFALAGPGAAGVQLVTDEAPTQIASIDLPLLRQRHLRRGHRLARLHRRLVQTRTAS